MNLPYICVSCASSCRQLLLEAWELDSWSNRMNGENKCGTKFSPDDSYWVSSRMNGSGLLTALSPITPLNVAN